MQVSAEFGEVELEGSGELVAVLINNTDADVVCLQKMKHEIAN